MQDRIIGFITSHCTVTPQQVEKMMMNTQMLTKDLGTILVGKQAVDLGIIAVSYTHLDVYKRQGKDKAFPL